MSELLGKAKGALRAVSADHLKFAAALATPFIGYGLFKMWANYCERHPEQPPALILHPHVSQLWVYPVKSCQGFQPKEAKLYPSGFEYDREWAIFNAVHGDTSDKRGAAPAVLSLRDIPRLRCVTATIDETEKVLHLTLSVDAHRGSEVVDQLSVPLERAEGERRVVDADLWDIPGTAYDEGEEVAAKLSKWFDFPVFLGRIKEQRLPSKCGMDGTAAVKKDRARLQDFSALHVITEEAVRFVQKGLPNHNITVPRFRANIVLCQIPHPDENLMVKFKVGDVEMRAAKLTGRCTVITVDENCKKDPMFNPTAYLKKHRMVKQTHRADEEKRVGEPIMGLNVFPVHDEDDEVDSAAWPKIVRVGDPVITTRTRRIAYEGALKF